MNTLNVLMLMAAALSVDFSVAQDPASGQTTERLHTRKDLVRFLRDYITAEETKVEQIRKWVNTLNILSEGSQDLYPPINAFKLMKKLNTDWGELESLVLQDMSDVTAHCHRESAASKYSDPDAVIISSETEALDQFLRIIECDVAGADTIVDVAKYMNYGCFCGKGGSGTPVDELDRCCQVHDDCYGKVQVDPNCKSWFWSVLGQDKVPYAKRYRYACDKKSGKAVCLESNDACQMVLCECDRVAAECFAKAPYNEENFMIDPSRCK